MLERQVEEQRALARGHEQRSVAEAGRLQTMEKLLEKKDLERTSMMVRALPPRVLYIGSGGALMPVGTCSGSSIRVRRRSLHRTSKVSRWRKPALTARPSRASRGARGWVSHRLLPSDLPTCLAP